MNKEKDLKEVLCEANKKVSFSQKSSIETKKALGKGDLEANGITFNVSKGQLVDSALFSRITRDCRGKLIRNKLVRRFRIVGSDEWFSEDAESVEEIWDSFFEITTEEDLLSYQNNHESKVKVNNSKSKKNTAIKIVVIGSALMIIYSLINKK